jgi:hypothetical protein
MDGFTSRVWRAGMDFTVVCGARGYSSFGGVRVAFVWRVIYVYGVHMKYGRFGELQVKNAVPPSTLNGIR